MRVPFSSLPLGRCATGLSPLQILLALPLLMMCTVQLIVAVVAHVVLIAPLIAEERTWLCDLHSLTGEAEIELKQPAELPGVGEVYVRQLNVRHPGHVYAEGLELRWDWGTSRRGGGHSSYRYSFIVGPNGNGRFFDFDLGEEQEDGRVTAPPRMRYLCETDADRRARDAARRAWRECLGSGADSSECREIQNRIRRGSRSAPPTGGEKRQKHDQ